MVGRTRSSLGGSAFYSPLGVPMTPGDLNWESAPAGLIDYDIDYDLLVGWEMGFADATPNPRDPHHRPLGSTSILMVEGD